MGATMDSIREELALMQRRLYEIERKMREEVPECPAAIESLAIARQRVLDATIFLQASKNGEPAARTRA